MPNMQSHLALSKSRLTYMVVVAAQLVKRSLLRPEVRGSNSVFGKNLFINIEHLCQLCIGKTKIKKREAGDGPFKKKTLVVYTTQFGHISCGTYQKSTFLLVLAHNMQQKTPGLCNIIFYDFF